MSLSVLKSLGILSIACFAIMPLFLDTYMLHLLILIFYFTYLSICWNIIGGFGGQLSLGHAMFLGIGSYTSTLLFIRVGLTPWLGMFCGGLLSALVAFLVGLLIFRYNIVGVFFAITTLAFAEICRLVIGHSRLLGGTEGLLIPLADGSFWSFQYESKAAYYYTMFIMMLVMLGISYLVRKSKYFYYLAALRADEDAADALGVNARKYKTLAFVVSAFFTGLGGTFFAQYYMFIEPETTFGVMISVDMIIRPIIGGVGTVMGPVVGSFIMTPLGEAIRALVGSGKSGVHLLIYGAVLMGICLWMPKGILPYVKSLFKHR